VCHAVHENARFAAACRGEHKHVSFGFGAHDRFLLVGELRLHLKITKHEQIINFNRVPLKKCFGPFGFYFFFFI